MLTLLHLDRLMDQMMSNMMEQVSTTTKQLVGTNFKPEDQVKSMNSRNKSSNWSNRS
jgi:hypothetical protein